MSKLTKNQERFLERVKFDQEHAEDKIKQFRKEVAESNMFSTTYHIKWKYEDLVDAEFQFTQCQAILQGVTDNEDWGDQIITWINADIKTNQRSVNQLSINNSTGMLHNAYEFYLLQARVRWMGTLNGYLHSLNRES